MTLALVPAHRGQDSLDLSGYDPQEFNILAPVLRLDTAAPYLRFRAVEVRLSPDITRGDCYAAPGARWVRDRGVAVPTLVAPAKPGLLKIASAAGLVIDPANSRRITPDACERCLEMARATAQAVRCGECPSRFDCAYQHVGAVRTDAGWRIVKASYEWNLDAQRRKLVREAKKRAAKAEEERKPFDPEDYVEDRLDQITSERYGLAETKSLLRLVRAICHLRQAYSREEMARPFLVVRTELAPDLDDPAVRAALAQKAVESSAEIFGGAREVVPVLPAATPHVVTALATGPDFSEAEVVAEAADEEDEEDVFGEVSALVAEAPEASAPVTGDLTIPAPVPLPVPEVKPAPCPPRRPAAAPAPAPEAAEPAPVASELAPSAEGARCDACGHAITPNVVAYCQSPRGRATFGGANLCYSCQRERRVGKGAAR